MPLCARLNRLRLAFLGQGVAEENPRDPGKSKAQPVGHLLRADTLTYGSTDDEERELTNNQTDRKPTPPAT